MFVDEYQDTNALQAKLYECLANGDGSNLFYVGDAKQSIYRFRLASPESFLQKRECYAPYTPGGPHPATLMLEDNFRSAQNVVGAVNDVFCAVMSREVGGIDYDMPYFLGYTGLSDKLLQKYIKDSSVLWEGLVDELPISTVGGTIGTHVGPGAIAVAFFAKENS